MEILDPLDLKTAVSRVKALAEKPGVKAVIFRSPCIAVTKGGHPLTVDPDICIGCRKCIRELGCPAIFEQEKKATIDPVTCTGCTLCTNICPTGAIWGGEDHE